MRRSATPRIRSNAAQRRRPAGHHWGWLPAQRTRCRGSCAAQRQAQRHRPSTAPSTGRRTRWPPPRAPRSRPRLPAAPAWPTTGLAFRSATRRAATPREYPRAGSKYLLGAQLLEFLAGLAEQPDVDVVGVLSGPRRAGVANTARRFREHRHDAWSQNRPREPLVVMLDQHVAGPQLRIVDHFGHCVDRTRYHACGGKGFDNLARLSLGGPGADDFVEFVLVAAAGAVGGEPVVGGQLRAAHRLA